MLYSQKERTVGDGTVYLMNETTGAITVDDGLGGKKTYIFGTDEYKISIMKTYNLFIYDNGRYSNFIIGDTVFKHVLCIRMFKCDGLKITDYTQVDNYMRSSFILNHMTEQKKSTYDMTVGDFINIAYKYMLAQYMGDDETWYRLDGQDFIGYASSKINSPRLVKLVNSFIYMETVEADLPTFKSTAKQYGCLVKSYEHYVHNTFSKSRHPSLLSFSYSDYIIGNNHPRALPVGQGFTIMNRYFPTSGYSPTFVKDTYDGIFVKNTPNGDFTEEEKRDFETWARLCINSPDFVNPLHVYSKFPSTHEEDRVAQYVHDYDSSRMMTKENRQYLKLMYVTFVHELGKMLGLNLHTMLFMVGAPVGTTPYGFETTYNRDFAVIYSQFEIENKLNAIYDFMDRILKHDEQPGTMRLNLDYTTLLSLLRRKTRDLEHQAYTYASGLVPPIQANEQRLLKYIVHIVYESKIVKDGQTGSLGLSLLRLY